MDPLDVLMNKDKVIPYFQPIFSADKQLVVGYEVLARIQTADGVQSLGSFFQDNSIPDEYRLEMDDHVQKLALDMYLGTDQTAILFFNYDATLFVKDNGETFIQRLEAYNKLGLDNQQIVLEFKEDDLMEEIDGHKHLFYYIQSLGIKLAIDGVRHNGNNLDLIAKLKPNIIKVDLTFMEDEELPHLYAEVHQPLSMLSRKLGATLLFESVSNFNQLNYSWRNGGRYYQGFYLHAPHPNFVDVNCCKEKMQKLFHHFIVYERKKMEAQFALSNELSTSIKQSMKQIQPEDPYDEMIQKIANEMDRFAFRIYICDAEGFQQSSNIEKEHGSHWKLKKEGRMKNWSWRPYFLENIVRMNIEKRGFLSDLYTDIERDERIRTYSYPISDQLYLFLDIPYEYLFEQEGLL
ncbi:EAL domain-containing protein [Halalkalibacter krulwichiae]|uniref:Putative EAL-domain containing protein YkuI n=1 Tax=Halalkalibacter krulwichiae TaxID=199441 RepID=A0A1X9ME59_9BACI|nr:EAL-associated domain-containing protein [Halalkalibacter krulwichiae]ARK30820.1 putative EAL-domain containing protein YkuI [Halalkalibacter krulwichiae]